MMKNLTRQLLLVFLITSASMTRAADIGPPVADYPFQKVAANIWVIHGPLEMPNPENQGFMNNPGVVLTEKGAVIVDPGASLQSGEMVLRMLKTVTDQPVIAVFNTHVHGDHWLGNQAIRTAYPDVTIYAHPQMLADVDAGAGDTWVELMDRLTEGATRGTQVVAPDQAVNDGDSVKIGGHTFRIHHHGQAHTKTDIMLEVVEEGAVFLGDNVTAQRVPRMTDGNFRGNIETIDRITKTGAKIWIPGHGPTGDASILTAYRGYLEGIYGAAKQAFDEGLDSSDVKPIALQATTAYKDWAGYADEVGRQGAQAYLEVEAVEF